MKDPIATWIRPDIRQLTTYQVTDPGKAIKLDAMENPYQWDVTLNEQWLKTLKTAALNRYPDPTARVVKQQLRAVMQIPEEMEVLLGNGSDELIQMLALTFTGKERVLLAPEPSFVMYRLLAQVVGMQYIGVPLDEDNFNLDAFAMLEAIETYEPSLIFLASPNNPTGNAFAIEDIESVLEIASGVVVIDEAYAPFTDYTWMSRLEEYPNLLVLRTVSELGLAGLRLGVLVGSPKWLEQIDKLRLPYNINVLTQLSAVFALQHHKVLGAQTQQIKADRTDLLKHLKDLKGVEAWPSQANFILFRVKDATAMFQGLKEREILIKNLHGSHPLLENCLQVTVGTPMENLAFLQALIHLM